MTTSSHAVSSEMMPFYQTPEFWVALAFVTVVAFFIRPVAKLVVSKLDERTQDIKTKLEEARKIREDAQALLAEYQRRQRDALHDADQIMKHAQEEVERFRAEVKEKLEETIHNREKQALDRVAVAQRAAVKDLKNVAAKLSLGIAERVLTQAVENSGSDSLIDCSLTIIPEKLN